ncbi:MAG: alpha/beta hydrolase [Hespellia sp.]|nr:alpha/beta hydrolase [Hespellia sp.]
MYSERITIWENKEYQYEGAFGFVPFLMTYFHEDETKRPCIVVVPGGGYSIVSSTEGEIVAKKFYQMGYHAVVCTYTTNLIRTAPLLNQPMKDLARTIRILRQHADEWQIDTSKIVVCGFSAGAHLCGSVCVHHEDIIDDNVKYAEMSNRPDAAILSYPVIFSEGETHKDSFANLLGNDATKEQLEYASIDKHVTEDTCPCFIWQTATDETVPVKNSYAMAQACLNHGVPFAHHVFTEGQHGLSLADDDWANGRFGELYTFEQTKCIISFMEENHIPIPKEMDGIRMMLTPPEEMSEEMLEEAKKMQVDMKANEEVSVWPELADTWLKKQL